MEKDQTGHLPPYPRRLDVFQVLLALGVGLLLLDSLEEWWGIETRWAWFPRTGVAIGISIAISLYIWGFTRPPFGPYAPMGWRRWLNTILACLAALAAVVVPSVV